MNFCVTICMFISMYAMHFVSFKPRSAKLGRNNIRGHV